MSSLQLDARYYVEGNLNPRKQFRLVGDVLETYGSIGCVHRPWCDWVCSRPGSWTPPVLPLSDPPGDTFPAVAFSPLWIQVTDERGTWVDQSEGPYVRVWVRDLTKQVRL